VVTVNSFTGKGSITVGERPAARNGRHTFLLPTANGGTVEGRLRTNVLDPHPRIDIAGVTHRTGPPVPVLLRVLALFPLALVAVGGLVGGAVGAAGFIGNLGISRGSQPTGVKALLMVVVLVVAVTAWVIVAAAIAAAIDAS
jgi:hypothetical protein